MYKTLDRTTVYQNLAIFAILVFQIVIYAGLRNMIVDQQIVIEGASYLVNGL